MAGRVVRSFPLWRMACFMLLYTWVGLWRIFEICFRSLSVSISRGINCPFDIQIPKKKRRDRATLIRPRFFVHTYFDEH